MRFFTVLAIIGALGATPALAKKQKKDTVVATEAPAVRTAGPALTDKTNQWLLDLSDGGRVTILLRPDAAPLTVERIKTLTRSHFYDGLIFHRVIDGFMAQGGDPKGDGTGGSSLPDIKAEFNYLPHVRGAVAAARAQSEDSANSQFYIVFQPKLALDHKYTVFGRVIDGMQYVDAIERGEPPAHPTRILHAWIASDNPPAYQPPAPDAAADAAKLLGPVSLPGAKSAPAKAPVKPKKP